ncbi:MAG: saccharopine dehydrogenase NADP-binding domain-containing protein [Chitinophagaceae bacterium]|nr:saccharopine dehydrogenase NADP-binding domain-containing protein [Chitinophagaceae bacterium]
MRNILIFGAGKSSTVLIQYLLTLAEKENFTVTVADENENLVKSKLKDFPHGRAASFNILSHETRNDFIRRSDLVISLLPPSLHPLIAKDCLHHAKHLITASYVDEEMKKMDTEAKRLGLLFLCEAGLDPGIDHMSAMQLIHRIRAEGGQITSFKSHCGGLVAPESDDNPWHYKISWNPRNIVLAGIHGARYLENQQIKTLRYEELFENYAQNSLNLPETSVLSWYPNRDSLPYVSLYGLEPIDTFVRTTLRHPHFMYGWKHIVKWKLTDETATYETDNKTLHELFQEHLKRQGIAEIYFDKRDEYIPEETQPSKNESVEIKEILRKQLEFLGFYDKVTKVNKGQCSAADILQFALEKKLTLKPDDKDMIVMAHEVEFDINNTAKRLISYLIVKGENALRTAMAKTVGLPMGISARLILNGHIRCKGVQIPVLPEIYEPVLAGLAEHNILFKEKDISP